MLVHPQFDPVAFQVFSFPVRWYGLMYVLGFLGGWALGRWRASREGSGWTARQVDDVIAYAVVGVVLGGRLGFALFYIPDYYLAHPLDLFQLWKGGMSFHGGLLGVMGALWFFAWRNKKTFLQVGDFLTPLVPPGLFFGRLGNFINGELWGRATDLPWAMVFADPRAGGLPRHPSQLYEAFLEGLVLFTVVWLYSRKPRATGRVSGLFLLLYGCFRFGVEFVRQPDARLFLGWMTTGQLLCAPMVGFGLWLLFRPTRYGNPG